MTAWRDVSEPQRRAALRQRAARRQRDATSSAATSASGAKSASRNVRGPRRLRGVTSASRNVERRDVSEPQRQSGAPSASRNVKRATSNAQRQARNVKRATWARCYVKAPKRQRGAKLVYAVVGEEQGRSRETTVPGRPFKNIYIFTSVSGVPLSWADPRNFGVLPRPVYLYYV